MTDNSTSTRERDARLDWERRIYTRLTDTAEADPSTALPAPQNVQAEGGLGHVRLSWSPVDGAAGYLIERTDGPDGESHIVGHGGSDVPAVPGHEFADTGIDPGVSYTYRIGAVTGAEYPVWAFSTPVSASPGTQLGEPVTVTVDASTDAGRLNRLWHMVGTERLTQLRFGPDASGHDIGTEFRDALQIVHDDLGVDTVRAHAILHDDNQVVTRSADGSLQFDFTIVDELYDAVLAIGIRPVVELSFMPAVIAAHPDETVFDYRGIICPPKDWAEWGATVGALTRHLVERYGIDEVVQWDFEVWNEPNLVVFWSGTQDEYFHLYAEAARAIKGVDERLRVGGPSTAASEWVEALAAYAEGNSLPLDFATSHTYGNLPLDTRPALRRHGFPDAAIYWTEWGVGSTHFGPIHDGVIGAPFVLSGYAAAQDRMDALAYWVASDHFEELGRPPRLFHNGFGLLTVGNLRKPRYWGVHLAAHQGDTRLESSLNGDGAQVLVQAQGTRHDDGTLDVLVWNGTINGELMGGDPRLDRRVTVELHGLDHASYDVELARVDAQHSNIGQFAPAGVDWPDEAQFTELRSHDELHLEELPAIAPEHGVGRLELELPMPGVLRLRLSAASGVRPPEESAR
jgi:xylan 1,4-beta-xylosidase